MALLLGALLTGIPAHAAITQREVDEAEQRFRAGDHASALGLFTALRARAEDPSQRHLFQWNIARCLEEMGEYAAAVEAFEVYRAEASNDLQRQTANARITTLEPRVFGGLAVACREHERLYIALDGTDPRPCPTTFTRVAAGTRTLIVTDERRREIGRRPVDIVASKTPTIYLGDRWLTAPLRPDVVTPAPPRPARSPWPWILTAGGLGLAAVGGALHYYNHSEFDALRLDPGSEIRRQTVDQSYVGAITFYGIGLSALASGLIWLVWLDDPPPVAPSAAGIGWSFNGP